MSNTSFIRSFWKSRRRQKQVALFLKYLIAVILIIFALFPIIWIESAEGPMKTSPLSLAIWAKRAFSARKPYPGWMASAPVISAAAMMAGSVPSDEPQKTQTRCSTARFMEIEPILGP